MNPLAPGTCPPLIVVVGATGTGKSALALRLASVLNGEIVNADSVQLYRGFDIGTAKTPVAGRQGIPHHLFDVIDLSIGYLGVASRVSCGSAGDYARMARAAIAEIAARGRVPIAVGGSGFYLRALLDGLPELPPQDQSLRAALQEREQRRPGSLHRLLARLDPPAAARMHAHDVHKTIRALEIRMLTRNTVPAAATAEPLSGYRILQIGLNPDRAKLVQRLNARVETMFGGDGESATSILAEVRGLLAAGATGTEKPFESLGYKQALAHIRADMTLEQAILSTQLETRQYAKRQRTWFARDTRIHWFAGFGESPSIAQEVLELIKIETQGPHATGISSAVTRYTEAT